MANDDIATPTALIGKKIAPILEIPTLNEIMSESMDSACPLPPPAR